MDAKSLVIEVLTDKPQYQKDIVKRLKEKDVHIGCRALREIFNDINIDFINGNINFVVVSNRNGSYKSTEDQVIRQFNKAKIKHAKSELWSAYNVNKRLTERDNLSLFDFVKEQFEGEE